MKFEKRYKIYYFDIRICSLFQTLKIKQVCMLYNYIKVIKMKLQAIKIKYKCHWELSSLLLGTSL